MSGGRPGTAAGAALVGLGGLTLALHFVTYNHVMEDAYISFRYAEMLAAGNGLVYNVGERVEGYSNFLWVVLLAALDFVGARVDVAARVMSLIALWGAMGTGWWLGRQFHGERGGIFLATLIAMHPLLRFHMDSGLETTAYGALTASLLMVVVGRGPRWLAAVLGSALVLMRPEGALFVGAVAPVLALRAREEGRDWKREVVQFLMVPGIAFLAQMNFRVLYYGEVVPNTVIAKRHTSGFPWLNFMAWVFSTACVPLVGAVGAWRATQRGETRLLGIGVLSMIAATLAFQITCGMALTVAWRYFAPAFIPSIIGVWLLVVDAVDRLRLGRAGATTLMTACVVWSGVTIGEPGGTGLPGALLQGVQDSPRARQYDRILEFAKKPDVGFFWKWYWHEEIHLNAWVGRWVKDTLPPDARWGIDQIGMAGYFSGRGQHLVDLGGIASREIARDGTAVGEVLRRPPDAIVVLSHGWDAATPREQRFMPVQFIFNHANQLNDLVRHPAFRARYGMTHILAPRERLTPFVYVVWTRNEVVTAPQWVELGPDTEEFNRWWRIVHLPPGWTPEPRPTR